MSLAWLLGLLYSMWWSMSIKWFNGLSLQRYFMIGCNRYVLPFSSFCKYHRLLKWRSENLVSFHSLPSYATDSYFQPSLTLVLLKHVGVSVVQQSVTACLSHVLLFVSALHMMKRQDWRLPWRSCQGLFSPSSMPSGPTENWGYSSIWNMRMWV